jgi:hypothetical protein
MNLKSLLAVIAIATGTCAFGDDAPRFAEIFAVEKSALSSTGKSDFFILEPGFAATYAGKEKGKKVVLIITVTAETKVVDGVETRVVEEKETADGETVEISRNYFAIANKTGDVYYFGEDSDTYEHGKVADHEGSWLAGVAGARFGLALPGKPEVGAAYCQEIAPGVAMDRAKILSVTETVKTPAGEYKNCVKIEETTPLESGKEYKYYAPGVGLVQDGELQLIKTSAGAKTSTASKNKQAQKGQARPAPAGSSSKPQVQDPMARAALGYVGWDADAEAYWASAINDPTLSANERKDLIEDLNEDGLSDPRHPSPDDMWLITQRVALIEDFAPYAMDEVNAAAFAEAYKDLLKLLDGQKAQ